MRVVQTLWSNNKNLIRNSFGWFSPKYHLMGWALSCLRLREYYNDLHLYTDTRGNEILINYLKLPYKKVHIHYDDIGGYSDSLWAIPKIVTYASQDMPFIHVDGDIFIWEKFSAELENAPLIAQNEEIGTECYKGKMDAIKGDLAYLPDFLKEEMDKESIPSYNAGILGGSDIEFFRRYTQMALDLASNNYRDEEKSKANIDFNILFEQILFHSLTAQEDKQVSCYYKDPILDNGYSMEFCDFSSVPDNLKYLHLIGGHKRNKETCILMSRILFQYYPEYFFKISALFQESMHFSPC